MDDKLVADEATGKTYRIIAVTCPICGASVENNFCFYCARTVRPIVESEEKILGEWINNGETMTIDEVIKIIQRHDYAAIVDRGDKMIEAIKKMKEELEGYWQI